MAQREDAVSHSGVPYPARIRSPESSREARRRLYLGYRDLDLSNDNSTAATKTLTFHGGEHDRLRCSFRRAANPPLLSSLDHSDQHWWVCGSMSLRVQSTSTRTMIVKIMKPTLLFSVLAVFCEYPLGLVATQSLNAA